MHYAVEDDGLRLAWCGTVFVNPPYNRQVGLWMAKSSTEVESGAASAVFALVAARTDTAW